VACCRSPDTSPWKAANTVSGPTSVSPGTIETNQTRFILDDPKLVEETAGAGAMMDRMGQPEEVASVVAFLASD